MKSCFCMRRAALGPLLFAGSICLAIPSHAQKVDFSGQKITLAIATPSGGGYDLYGRLVARHLGKFLPGNPTVVPQNMPGAGSLIAANWLANVAPKDGTGLAIIPSATLFENLLGNSSARFDAQQLNWLVSLNDYTAIAMVWHETPFATASDMLTRDLLVGSNAPASDTTVWPQLLNALIGTKIKMVRGYPGTTGIALAMERGEVQGMIGDDWASVKANKADWLREKKVRILMQMTAARHPDLPEVPVVGEFAKDEDKRQVLELFVLRQKYGRPFLAPPATPSRVVAAYREAFGKLVKDADFLREAARAHLIIKIGTGEEVTALVSRIHDSPKPVIEQASALVKSFSE